MKARTHWKKEPMPGTKSKEPGGACVAENKGDMQDVAARLRICVVGQFSVQGLPTQGEELARHLQEICGRVDLISRSPSRPLRLLEVFCRLLLFAARYDSICIQTFGRKALILEAVAILLARAWRRRVVLCLRGGDLPDSMAQSPRLYRWFYRRAQLAVCPSEFLRQALAPHQLAFAVIPNALEPRDYLYRVRSHIRPRLLWMRTFYPYYNPMLALRAFASVHRRYPEARLTMAGFDSGMEQEVRQAAAAMGLPVAFPGFIPKEEIPAVMDAHDIYLNTPHIDNMPITVIEALLCGLPVVSTSVGGIPYLLRHGETGLLVGDDDAEACAAAIVRLVEEPALGERLSCAGRRYAETFSWQNILPLWAKALAPERAKSQDSTG